MVPRFRLFLAILPALATLSACAAPNAPRTTAIGQTPEPGIELARYEEPTKVAPNDDSKSWRPTSRSPYITPERLDRGYTIVIIGINGDNWMSAGLMPGLVDGGYPGAVETVDWTTGFLPLMLYHLRATHRQKDWAHKIADKILAYQARYPGRPVNIVGYSAGAAMAVRTLESMPDGSQVDRAILLAGAIAPLHNLSVSLARTRFGFRNYYQPQDVVALWAGTLAAGTTDGYHTISAGAIGFWRPLNLSAEEEQLYNDKLVQLPYQPHMALSGNLGEHFQAASRRFVAEWIAPQLIAPPLEQPLRPAQELPVAVWARQTGMKALPEIVVGE